MEDYPALDPEFFELPPWIKIAGILNAAEFHWHFVQGIKAIDARLYIPGCLSLLAGIEASIRLTFCRMHSKKLPLEEDLGPVLSNSLLRRASTAGMPVTLLAFPGESDFLELVETRTPETQIVKIRNDLAHGNVLAFINRDLGDRNAFFTPECLRDTADALWEIAFRWAEGIAAFRRANIAQSTFR